MPLQQLLVDPRFEIEAFEVGRRSHFEQVLESGAILAQQRQVVAGFLHVAGSFLGPAARRNVRFVTDNGLDAAVLGLLVELQGAVQIAVVRQRQGVHALVSSTLDQPVDRAGAVQQAVMAVAVQMSKWLVGHGYDPSRTRWVPGDR